MWVAIQNCSDYVKFEGVNFVDGVIFFWSEQQMCVKKGARLLSYIVLILLRWLVSQERVLLCQWNWIRRSLGGKGWLFLRYFCGRLNWGLEMVENPRQTQTKESVFNIFLNDQKSSFRACTLVLVFIRDAPAFPNKTETLLFHLFYSTLPNCLLVSRWIVFVCLQPVVLFVFWILQRIICREVLSKYSDWLTSGGAVPF